MIQQTQRPMSPWQLLRLAEVYDANGDRPTAAMLLDCAFAAFSAMSCFQELSDHSIDDG